LIPSNDKEHFEDSTNTIPRLVQLIIKQISRGTHSLKVTTILIELEKLLQFAFEESGKKCRKEKV
jgi:hypothetical protein